MRRARVALLVETSSSYGRSILAGVNRFMMSNGDWSVFLEQRSLTNELPQWLSQWRGEGIISRTTTRELGSVCKRKQIPLVDLTDRFASPQGPTIRASDETIGRMAAEHLLERGFRQYAFCGFQREAWSDRREKSFLEAISAEGTSLPSFRSPWGGDDAPSWDAEQHRMTEWLADLPKPIGVLACNDVRAQHLLNVCRQAGISSPEEVAVVGVDNDELLCDFCRPTLTSVIPNAEEVGYRAAEVLQKLMNNEPIENEEQIIEPLGLATRQSTDVSAIADPDVAAAVRLIREDACSGLTVADLLDHVPLSRSALERGFRKFLHRSPQGEIRRVRLNRVKQLLSETDLPLARIAVLTGFDHPEYLSVMFKRDLGCTPGEFRRSVRVEVS